MSSLLATVLAAVRPGAISHDLDDVEAEPDANASNLSTPLQEASLPGGNMSNSQTVAGIAALANASADTAATASALAIFTSVMSADAIKGDAGRMSAAVSLLALAPALAADSIVAFVAEHVPAAAAAAAPPPAAPAAPEAAASAPTPPAAAALAGMSYDDRRVAAANLAMPGAAQAGDDPVKRIMGHYGAVTGNAGKR